MMTTTALGQVLPTFTEQYGDDKKIDLMFTPSHNLFTDGMPGSKMSGVYIDKNGNFKMKLNIGITITVETSKSSKSYEEVRNVYMTMVFKMKVKQDDSNPFSKKFAFTPRSLEIAQMKVLEGDQEKTTEQMMLQSMANLQLEAIKKKFNTYNMGVGDIIKKNPKEIKCLGFIVSDLDFSFQKSQAQFTAYYKPVEKPSKEFCAEFFENLKEMPKKFDDYTKNAAENPMMKDLASKNKKLTEGTAKKESSDDDIEEIIKDDL